MLKQNKKKKGTIIEKSLSSLKVYAYIEPGEVKEDFQKAIDEVGVVGKDGQHIVVEICSASNGKEVELKCSNAEEVKFSDYMSDDEEKKTMIRNLVKFWTHLAKMGYDIQ